jgi:beta-1,4-mannosyl-glycoprotein beta-1,4-N-acetylglucosaminyltransferase
MLRLLILVCKRIYFSYLILIRKLIRKLPFDKNETPELSSVFLQFTKVRKKGSKRYVIDCCYFFNEIEILELRLEVLHQHVDKFIIIESRFDLNGNPKELHLSQNLQRFRDYLDKIEIVVLDAVPSSRERIEGLLQSEKDEIKRRVYESTLKNEILPKDGSGPLYWLNEYFMKEYLLIPLSRYISMNNAIVYISDVDEIWNPYTRFKRSSNKVYLFKQRGFVYFINNASNDSYKNWTGTATASIEMVFKLGPNRMRAHKAIPRRLVYFGGWHFSAMGGVERVQEKVSIWDPNDFGGLFVEENLENAIKKKLDLRGRKIRFRTNTRGFPEEILNFERRYPHFYI